MSIWFLIHKEEHFILSNLVTLNLIILFFAI